jgi:hypothetical protein
MPKRSINYEIKEDKISKQINIISHGFRKQEGQDGPRSLT